MAAPNRDNNIIDFDRLSQRELLIILVRDVKSLKEDQKTNKETRERLISLETKVKVNGSFAGAISGFIMSLFIGLFKTLIK